MLDKHNRCTRKVSKELIMHLTRAQRVALRDKVLLRSIPKDTPAPKALKMYRALRRKVVPVLNTIAVPFAGMWLQIEPDGHTHS